jgi:hypothetical protein
MGNCQLLKTEYSAWFSYLDSVNNFVKLNAKNKSLKGTQILAVVSIKITVFWDVMPFVLVQIRINAEWRNRQNNVRNVVKNFKED